jgi:hypothetical protein
MKREVLTDSEEQVRRWVAGESLHSDHRGLGEECCPDFSCCTPSLLQPVEARRAFQAADGKGRDKLCMAFLGGLLSKKAPDLRVYITGGESSPKPKPVVRLPEFDKLHLLTGKKLRALGCGGWDGGLYLFPVEWYDHIPRGLHIESISGRAERFAPGVTPRGSNMGFLAFGVRIGPPTDGGS